MKKIVFLVSGNGAIFQSVIDACDKKMLTAKIVCVIADKECPALKKAKKHSIPYYCFVRKKIGEKAFQNAVHEALIAHNPDVICLTFDSLIGEEIINSFPDRIINIHPSLLPAFPGFNALSKSTRFGVKYVGATVHLVDKIVDGGPIICQFVQPIKPGINHQELGKMIFFAQAKMVLQTIDWMLNKRMRVKGRETKIINGNYTSFPFCPSLEKFKDEYNQNLKDHLF